MSLDQSVNFNSVLTSQVSTRPYLNAAMETFTPSTAPFLAGFIAGAEYKDGGGEGIASKVTVTNWESRLKAWGATEEEPIWQVCSAYFNARGAEGGAGFIPANITRPPHLIIGRRTRAVPSEVTIVFTAAGAAGTSITCDVNQAPFIYSAGELATFTVDQDGLKTTTDLRDEMVAGLNAITAFAALYLAAPVGPATMTITSLADGFPLLVLTSATTGGPSFTQAVTTANTPGDYALDLDDLRLYVEDSDDPSTGVPGRKFFWISDSQLDDVVNEEGAQWVEDAGEETLPRLYVFCGESLAPENFDPAATASPAQDWQAAVGGVGFSRAGIFAHDLLEWFAPAALGRVIGYLPGECYFSARELYGSGKYAKITPRDQGENASLAEDRRFNYYSAEGPHGSILWDWISSGKRLDQRWVEAYASYQVNTDLTLWKIQKQDVTYDDDTISAAVSVIKAALLKIPGIAKLPNLISVTAKRRAAVDPNLIAQRTYVDFTITCAYVGSINRFGTISQPVTITISETL